MSQQVADVKRCAIVVRQGRDDQRVDKLLSLIPDDILVVLFSGETGSTCNVLRAPAAKRRNGAPTSVDFVLLHREDESCWKNVKERLSDGTGMVFYFQGEGTPRTLVDPASLPIRRRTIDPFEITETDILEIIEHVYNGGQVPSCCQSASNYLLAIKGLCEGFAMSQSSPEDLASKGVSNPTRVQKAAVWFAAPSNWQKVLGNNLLNNLAEERVFPGEDSKIATLHRILEESGEEAASGNYSQGQTSEASSGFTLDLISAIANEVCEKLKKHA